MAATAIRNDNETRVVTRDLPGADEVTYLDLDGDGVPDAVRTTKVTHLPAAVAGPCTHVVESVETVDEDGGVRLLSLVERFETRPGAAVA
jgi:hypothetical protein